MQNTLLGSVSKSLPRKGRYCPTRSNSRPEEHGRSLTGSTKCPAQGENMTWLPRCLQPPFTPCSDPAAPGRKLRRVPSAVCPTRASPFLKTTSPDSVFSRLPLHSHTWFCGWGPAQWHVKKRQQQWPDGAQGGWPGPGQKPRRALLFQPGY